MNILFVNEIPMNPLFGGIERVTDLLTKELLMRSGYNVFYLSSIANRNNILEYPFPAKQFVLPHKGGFEHKDNVIYYEQLLRENKIDIVINQRGWAPFMDNVLCINGVPTISVLHSVPKGFHIIYMQNILRYNKSFDGLWRYLCKLVVYPIYYAYKYFESITKLKKHYKCLALNSSAIVLLSKGCKREFDDMVFSFNEKCITCVIPNPTISRPHEKLLKENIVLYVGRLSVNEKNPIRLLKIWRKLYAIHLEWKLIIVGDGDALNDMLAYVKRYRLDRVEFHGKSSNVDAYYKKADFICLTSNFEGWGMTLTEGMAFGCVPITFDNYGAASEIIDDDINGCLIPAFNLELYAMRLSELMYNKAKRVQMAKNAEEKVKRFALPRVVDKWEQLFEKIKLIE